MMGDVLDSAMEADGSAEEEDKIVNQVLDEIGINLKELMVDAPTNSANANKTEEKQGMLKDKLKFNTDNYVIIIIIIVLL